VFRAEAFRAGARRGKLAALPSAFDILAYVRRLRSVGVSQEQAEADAEALSAAVLDTLATKQDLRDLEFRLTIRLGGMVGVSVATVAALTKLL